jgi:peptidoglycan/xylan/chitin deacetylase (PgdA/CDA1 family)
MLVRKGTLERHLQYLKRKYVVVSTARLLEHLKQGNTLPSNAIVITFDDGLMESYSNALPLLQRYGITATFFIIGNSIKGDTVWLHRLYDLVDVLADKRVEISFHGPANSSQRFLLTPSSKLKVARTLKTMLLGLSDNHRRRILDEIALCGGDSHESSRTHFMTQRELRNLLAKGHGVGGHSMGHDRLTVLDPEEASKDLEACHEMLRTITERQEIPFAYPFGQGDSFNPLIKSKLAEQGFSCAFTTIEGLNDRQSDPFELRRIEIGEFSKAEFMAHVTGTMGLMKDVARKVLG